MLSMARFQDVLHHAKCSHNSIKFTFKKEVAFDQVHEAWQWINDADDNYVVLVTENSQCNVPDGDNTSRQPWHITRAIFDDSKNTVTLTAKSKTWENAFSHWHLKIDSTGLLSRSQQRLTKRLGIDESFSLSLAASLPADPIDLTEEGDDISASVACDPCYTTGSLDFKVDATYRFPFSLDGSITMTPNDLAASVTAKLHVEGEVSSGKQVGKEIFTYVPEGINIPGLATIGPAFKVDLVAGIDAANAEIDLSSGVTMSIPADAIAVLDFSDTSKNQFSGWVPGFEDITPSNQFSEEISISAFAGVQLRAEFDLEILSKGLSAGLALDAPKLDLTVTAAGDTGHEACGIEGADFGVSLDLSLGAELDAFAGFGDADDLPNKQQIFATSVDLYSTCFTVVGGEPTPTPTPSASAGLGNGSYSALASSGLAGNASVSIYPSSSIFSVSESTSWSSSASVLPGSSATLSSSSVFGAISSSAAWPSSTAAPASSSTGLGDSSVAPAASSIASSYRASSTRLSSSGAAIYGTSSALSPISSSVAQPISSAMPDTSPSDAPVTVSSAAPDPTSSAVAEGSDFAPVSSAAPESSYVAPAASSELVDSSAPVYLISSSTTTTTTTLSSAPLASSSYAD